VALAHTLNQCIFDEVVMGSVVASQLRAARGLLGWSQKDLATAAQVGRATIADFEVGKREPYARTLADLRRALEEAGVEFTNGGEPGVKLRKSAVAAPMVPEHPTHAEADPVPQARDPQVTIRKKPGISNISPEQVKAARELLGWSQGELAAKLGVSETAVSLFEREKRRLLALDVSAVRNALEAAGVEFTNGAEPGAKLAPDATPKPDQATMTLEEFLSRLDAYEERRLRSRGVPIGAKGGVKYGFSLLHNRDAASLLLQGKELGRLRWINGGVEFDPAIVRSNPAHGFEDDLDQWAASAYARSFPTSPA
jgi:transcriptional regulator with XRE-family HTH domain